jgi:hypothetical protein
LSELELSAFIRGFAWLAGNAGGKNGKKLKNNKKNLCMACKKHIRR